MPNRDYAVRSKSKNNGNKLLILLIIILLLLLSGLGLWILSTSHSDKKVENKPVQTQPAKKELPTRPEEIYSYIRDLETREVPVDKNSKLARLTKEQEQQILKQQEEEKRKQEQLLAQQSPESGTISLSPEQLAEQQAREKQLAEEKRKQAELNKQQELEKKAELLKQHLEKEKNKTETAKVEKQQPTKIVASAKPASEAPKSVGKYGLQCGAFKSKAQAENMQARLAMAGYNARVSSSADWNRVVVGPIGDRAAASAAQSNARSVAECLIVGM